MDSTTANLKGQGPSGEQLGCLSAVEPSNCAGSSTRTPALPIKSFVELVWNSHHWLPPSALRLLVCEGRSSLFHLSSKMKAMRLQTAKKLLYTNTVPWVMFRVSALRTECRKGLNRPMILMSNNASNILSTKKTGSGVSSE